jgi:hypothetical protein
VIIVKVTDYAAIAGYGIVSTPGIVIDGKVVHAGGLPNPSLTPLSKYAALSISCESKKSRVALHSRRKGW